MKIEDIEKLGSCALKDMDNVETTKIYVDELIGYIKENKIDDEIISVVIRNVDVDKGANFFDELESLPVSALQSVVKKIKGNDDLTKHNANSLKFLCGMTYMCLLKSGNMDSVTGTVFLMLAENIKKNVKEKNEVYPSVLEDYLIEEIKTGVDLPDWSKLKISAEAIKIISEELLKITGKNDKYERNLSFKTWLNNGRSFADAEIERLRIEEKLPKSRIKDLRSITDHYEEVEKNFKKAIYENDRLEKKVERQSKEILNLNGRKNELEYEISELKKEILQKKELIHNTEAEIEEAKTLNKALNSLKKNDEEAMLKEIADALRTEYIDYIDSKDDPMDLELGEIYKEKIKNIFKILENNGVKVD
jgi:hypothetical protein